MNLQLAWLEVIKYGILGDAAFFQWIDDNKALIAAHDDTILAEMILKCCQCKADIVAADETEAGLRALLNLGHTFGHAIEAEQGYGQWLHGEAVAAGMVQAAQLANEMDLLSDNDVARIKALIEYFDLPVSGPDTMSLDDYLRHMARDKKILQESFVSLCQRLLVKAKLEMM